MKRILLLAVVAMVGLFGCGDNGANPGTPSTTYTLSTTVSPSGSGSVSRSPNQTTYTSGTNVTVTATPRTNYAFAGWSGASTATSASITITMNANKTLTANFVNVFTDTRDGKTYETMKVGLHTWMAENLNYQTSSGSWCYGNLTSNCNSHGRLYDWNTAMAGSSSSTSSPSRVRGVCPAGWHLPSRTEWSAFLIGDNLDSFLSGGYRNSNGSFINGNIYGYWWTATAYTTNNAYNRRSPLITITTMEENSPKEYGFSVRCVQD